MTQENENLKLAPEKIRAFIGIRPNQAVMEFFRALKQCHQNAPWAKQLRWTKPENIHLTMRFLGDVEEQQLQNISDTLVSLLQNQPAFGVTVTSPQAFPSIKKPRMIASFVHKSTDLQKLAEQIDSVVVRYGVPPENRPFRGHITIGRFRRLAKRLDELSNEITTIDMPCDHIILFRSDLKPTGAEYSIVRRITFK